MVATRFSVALHILILIARDTADEATSARMALSIGTNPVVVRRIAGHLARAGLIVVQRGPGGASLARPAEQITLRDVWRAIHPERDRLIKVHPRTNRQDPVGKRMPELLRARFDAAEAAMLDDLQRSTVAGLVAELQLEAQPA
ncbi:MAG: Rrf2 family transcriptional regulator [Acetobacteraceae bacterium]|nr:Rrf2 family transcriptional regulator [Acetobacteraceae bacterium]